MHLVINHYKLSLKQNQIKKISPIYKPKKTFRYLNKKQNIQNRNKQSFFISDIIYFLQSFPTQLIFQMNKTVQRIAENVWSLYSYQNYKSNLQYFCPTTPVFQQLAQFNPIVSHQKVLSLRNELLQCEEGKSMMLHMGDCAEPFEHVNTMILKEKVEFFKECMQALKSIKKMPITHIGRFAGQYAKPRSSQFVIIEGQKVHNYKGDNINSYDMSQRNPSVERILEGYTNATKTYNFKEQAYPELFTSHEGLVLPYEASLTRNIDGQHFCLSAHMLWIGERTRQIDGAHVQFFRGIKNPIGVKISHKIDQEGFYELVTKLNPENEKGKLLVIIRMGKDNITHVEKLIKCKKSENLNFLFVSDPMHGNTYQSMYPHKLKTRNLAHVIEEIKYFQKIMKTHDLPFGYSFESSHEQVTECFGLCHPQEEDQLDPKQYLTKCDPRINSKQILKLFEFL